MGDAKRLEAAQVTDLKMRDPSGVWLGDDYVAKKASRRVVDQDGAPVSRLSKRRRARERLPDGAEVVGLTAGEYFAGGDAQTKADFNPLASFELCRKCGKASLDPQSRPWTARNASSSCTAGRPNAIVTAVPATVSKTPPWWPAAVSTRSSVRMATRRSASGSSFRS